MKRLLETLVMSVALALFGILMACAFLNISLADLLGSDEACRHCTTDSDCLEKCGDDADNYAYGLPRGER